MYISPVEFDQILRDPIPLTSVIRDTEKLFVHGVGLLFGQDDDNVETGPYHDQSRLWRLTSEIIPGINTIKRFNDLGKTEY